VDRGERVLPNYIKGVSRVISQNILGILFDMIKSPEATARHDLEPRRARDLGTTAWFRQGHPRLTAGAGAFSIAPNHDGVTARPAVNDARARTLITVDELIRLMTPALPSCCSTSSTSRARAGGAAEDSDALSVHLATGLFGTPTATSGRRPLRTFRPAGQGARVGIGNATPVVVYDNAGSAQASRAWWTLRWAGLTDVRVLDGGCGAWAAAGRPFSTQVANRASRAGDVVLTSGHMPTSTPTRRPARPAVTPARCAPRASYGRSAKAGTGHIPGAFMRPAGGNIADGKIQAERRSLRRLQSSSAPMALRPIGSIAAAAILRPRHRRHGGGRARHCALRSIVVGLERRSGAPGRDRNGAKVARVL